MRKYRALSVLILMLATTAAKAETFDTVGVTCVPAAVNYANQDYKAESGGPYYIQWNGVSSGTINLHCPIPGDVSSPSNLWFAYKNNTTGAGCSGNVISVSYMKMNKNTGGVSTIGT